MEPSSIPFDASQREVLAARDARQVAMDRCLGLGVTIVAASLAVPGPSKVPRGAMTLWSWGLDALRCTLPASRKVYVTCDALGPFELWSTPGDAAIVKRRCIALETAKPAARLLDLDVYSPEGIAIDRTSLHLPPRACLCCGEPARDCMRAGRHAPGEVVARALDLVATFRA